MNDTPTKNAAKLYCIKVLRAANAPHWAEALKPGTILEAQPVHPDAKNNVQ